MKCRRFEKVETVTKTVYDMKKNYANQFSDFSVISYPKDTKTKEHNQLALWICTCVGLIIGIGIVIMDFCFTTKPTLTHPVSMIAFSLALSAVGFAVGKTVGFMSSWTSGRSLQPPEDLGMNDNSKDTETNVPEKKTKYSKAQARQRYKQGKL